MIGIDLFSGCGGLSEGAKLAGVEIKYANEIDLYSAKTYKSNHPEVQMYQKDIRELKKSDFNISKRQRVILFGGPPCQGFSFSNQKTRTSVNEKNWLFTEFIRISKELMPEWIVFENVKGFLGSIDGYFYNETVKMFRELGYVVSVLVLNAADYGVPQNRKRVFLICSIDQFSIHEPKSLPYKISVGDSILDLPTIENGARQEILEYDKNAETTYAKKMRSKSGTTTNHCLTKNSNIVIERFKYIPQGGNWQNIPSNLIQNYKDVSRCHSGIYHRLNEKLPSVVIGNFRKNMLIHPRFDRGLSVREAARLQSFNDGYFFCGPLTSQQQQVGNAVPPLLAKVVFSQIVKGC